MNPSSSHSARDAYLVNQVLTASPPALHLMLIEAACRHLRAILHSWSSGDADDQAGARLLSSQEIVANLLAGLRSGGTPWGRKLAGIYVFVHRRLIEAYLRRSEQAVQDALRVLEHERETWRAIVDQFAAASSTDPGSRPRAPSDSSQCGGVKRPDSGAGAGKHGTTAGTARLSLEA